MTCTADRDLPSLLELAACALPGLDGKLDAITPELLLPGAAGGRIRKPARTTGRRGSGRCWSGNRCTCR